MLEKIDLKERLISIRERKGFTQKEVAMALNITQQGYSAYETGAVIPPLEIVLGIAKLYSVSLDELVYGGKCLKEDRLFYSLPSELIKKVWEDDEQREALIEYARYLEYKKEVIKAKN